MNQDDFNQMFCKVSFDSKVIDNFSLQRIRHLNQHNEEPTKTF